MLRAAVICGCLFHHETVLPYNFFHFKGIHRTVPLGDKLVQDGVDSPFVALRRLLAHRLFYGVLVAFFSTVPVYDFCIVFLHLFRRQRFDIMCPPVSISLCIFNICFLSRAGSFIMDLIFFKGRSNSWKNKTESSFTVLICSSVFR